MSATASPGSTTGAGSALPPQSAAVEVQRILRLYREQYLDWSVRHFYSFAGRNYAVTLSYSFIRLAAQEAGLPPR